MGKPIDRLICNAGVYQPSLPYAKWSADGHEQTMQINYLSHFLMVSLLMPEMVRAPDPRVARARARRRFLDGRRGENSDVRPRLEI